MQTHFHFNGFALARTRFETEAKGNSEMAYLNHNIILCMCVQVLVFQVLSFFCNILHFMLNAFTMGPLDILYIEKGHGYYHKRSFFLDTGWEKETGKTQKNLDLVVQRTIKIQ